jgi:hypothetical protein
MRNPLNDAVWTEHGKGMYSVELPLRNQVTIEEILKTRNGDSQLGEKLRKLFETAGSHDLANPDKGHL